MDKVTLGIPIYNAANLVERTLLSALNQTYPNIEFIFVDDKGNSMDIVRRIIAEHPRRNAVRIIDQNIIKGLVLRVMPLLRMLRGNIFLQWTVMM